MTAMHARGWSLRERLGRVLLRIVVGLALVVVCGGLAVGAAAGEGVAEHTPGPTGENGTLEGTVTDADTGDAIENASVIVADTEDASVAVTATDENGEYERSLEPGVYAVGVAAEGYEPAVTPAVEVLPGETTEHDVELMPTDEDPALVVVDDPEAGAETDHLWGALVTGEEERTLEEIELDYSGTGADLSEVGELDLFVTINGEVIEPVVVNNVDSETIEIDLDPPLFDPPKVEPGDVVGVAMINEQVENPPVPGEYGAEIELREGGDAFTGGTAPFEIVDETGTLAGTVTDAATGEVVGNASVVAVNESEDHIGGALTDDDGSYGTTLIPSEYNVTVLHPEYEPAVLTDVTVEGNETTTLDVTLTPATEAFVVPAVETSAPVEAGEELVVEPTVLNAGAVNGTQTVELLVDGTPADSAEVSLEPGETWDGALSDETDEDDRPAVNVTVATGNASAEQTAQVHEPVPDARVGDVNEDGELTVVDAVLIQQHLAGMEPEPFNENLADVNRDGEITIVDAVLIQQYLADLRGPGNATIASFDAPSEVTAGEMLNASASVENTGGMGTIQAVEYRLAESEDGLTENATEAVAVVDLAPGNTTDTAASIGTDDLVPGEYTLGVFTDDTAATTDIEVTLPDPDATVTADSPTADSASLRAAQLV